MAAAVRRMLAVAGLGLILFGLIWVFAPEEEILGWKSVGFLGTPVLPTEKTPYYTAGILWLGITLCTQWLFLRPRGGWTLHEGGTGRPMRAAAIGAGFCGMLVSFGLVAALMEIPDWWAGTVLIEDDGFHPGVYAGIVALWIVWAVVFYRSFRSPRSVLRALIAGTILELLVAAPVHAACYRRDDCYCARGSYTALVFGGTALFWVFGPGIFLLYLGEHRRRRRLLRACPHCGADLSGSAAEVCPGCGGATPVPEP